MTNRRCQICLKNYNNPHFNNKRICICGHCKNFLNKYSEPAEESYKIIEKRLRDGIYNRAITKLNSTSSTEQEKQYAIYTLNNFDKVYNNALQGWITKLANDTSNTSKIYKIIRAERRGLLLKKGENKLGYPSSESWKKISTYIKKQDEHTCHLCKKTNVELHVHHIVYLSNYGTNRRKNLITLCRSCHEDEHKKSFDFGESKNIDFPFTYSLTYNLTPLEVEIINYSNSEVINSNIEQAHSKSSGIKPTPTVTPQQHKQKTTPSTIITHLITTLFILLLLILILNSFS